MLTGLSFSLGMVLKFVPGSELHTAATYRNRALLAGSVKEKVLV